MVAAIITGGIFACGAAAGLAYADHVATGSDFLTCIRVFVPLALAGAIVGAVGGAFLDPAYVWPDPAEEVVNLIYEDSSSVSSMSSTELSEFLRSDTGIEFLFG